MTDESGYFPARGMKDLEPFSADPALGAARRLGWSASRVLTTSTVALVLVVVLAAALSNNGFWASFYGRSTLEDISAAFTSPAAATVGTQRVPLLRDYQSLFALFLIILEPWLIFSLFRQLEVLHSDLVNNDCLEISQDSSIDEVNSSIVVLNQRWASAGTPVRSLVVFGAIWICFILIAGVGMRHEGFSYLVRNPTAHQPIVRHLYEGWWARPFLPGFFAWTFVGAFGAYMIYVEAIVGLRYVALLRRSHGKYRFRANRYNVDGSYGWSAVRNAYTFMVAGVATTALSSFPIYMMVRSWMPAALVVIGLFLLQLMVLYVSLASALILRRHVRAAREDEVRGLVTEQEMLRHSDELIDLVRSQVNSAELRYFQQIPDFPVVTGWTVTAAVVTIAGFLAAVAQIVSVIRTPGL